MALFLMESVCVKERCRSSIAFRENGPTCSGMVCPWFTICRDRLLQADSFDVFWGMKGDVSGYGDDDMCHKLK
jgi:hypothetical protein